MENRSSENSTSEFIRCEFHNPYKFDFTKELEANWEVIRREYDNLREELFHPWPESNLFAKDGQRGEGWDVFGLYAFGKKHHKNMKLCPETTKLVEKIPGISTAAFSVLNEHSRILPHVGYYGYSEMVLRCHLGLYVPSQDLVYLQVGNKRQSWYDGKCMVFDDTFTHSAINDSDKPRVILLLDFSTGIPIPKELMDSLVDEDGQKRDQTAYLDQITRAYGYGVEDDDDKDTKKANTQHT